MRMATMWRLIVLIAVLLMPLGTQPAAAAPAAHHSASMPMQHCPDQRSNHNMTRGLHECTMACSAALPAADLASHEPLLIVCEPILPTAAERLQGLHPEAATPPPKLA
jgi:hypothetical protein